MSLTNEQLVQLDKLQQGELDAALLYRRLAELAKTDTVKTALKKIAADESRHAAMASRYTGSKLTPSKKLATIGGVLAQVIGLRATMKFLAKAENAAEGKLAPMCEFCSEMSDVINDEREHARVLTEMASSR